MLQIFVCVCKSRKANLIICFFSPHIHNVNILFIALKRVQLSFKCSSLPGNTFNCLNGWEKKKNPTKQQ